MKPILCLISAVLLTLPQASADGPSYTNFIRQFQTPSGVQWDASDQVASSGSQQSALVINPGGARFALWTIKNSPLTEYLLTDCYVGTYVPRATVVIRSEDPYPEICRTRADRPFYVEVTVDGLLDGTADPEASKSVKLIRKVQSYGVGGTGIGIDRTQASLYSQAIIASNGTQTLTYAVNAVPGADRTKVRGEETFAVFSVRDYRPPTYDIPETQIASQFIQIWPVADGSITGLTQGQIIRYAMPQVTFTLNDCYPNSRNYAQVYKGAPQLGVAGTVVPGSQRVFTTESLPQNLILTANNYDATIDSDGIWTMELLTETPFGTDRLSYVSFTVDRTIDMNGSFTTSQ